MLVPLMRAGAVRLDGGVEVGREEGGDELIPRIGR
jgi:hypothetical protein